MRRTKNTFKDLVAANLGSSRTRGHVVKDLGSSGVVQIGALPSGSLSIDSAQGSSTPGVQVGDQVAQLSTALNDLKAAQQSQIDTLTQNTRAATQSSISKSSGSSLLDTAGTIASSLFGGLSGLSPIISGLVSLFGGGSSNTVAAPTPFSLPSAVRYEGGYNAGTGQVTPIDYGQSGTVRQVGGNGATASSAASTTVQIQVNAMDSRSFLDHSDEIAQAVRRAMLNSSSINDVIADL